MSSDDEGVHEGHPCQVVGEPRSRHPCKRDRLAGSPGDVLLGEGEHEDAGRTGHEIGVAHVRAQVVLGQMREDVLEFRARQASKEEHVLSSAKAAPSLSLGAHVASLRVVSFTNPTAGSRNCPGTRVG